MKYTKQQQQQQSNPVDAAKRIRRGNQKHQLEVQERHDGKEAAA